MDLPIDPQAVVKQKLKPQIEAKQMTEAEADEYVRNYMDEAGGEFQEAIQSQVDQVKAQFQSIVQKISTLSASLLAIPTILANPMTIAVANQTLMEILGNIKSVSQDITSIMGKVQQMTGSVPSVMNTLQDSANSVQEEAESSIQLVNLTVDGEERDLESTTVVVSGNTGTSTVVWEGITPTTHIQLNDEVPTGITHNISGTTLTLTINKASFTGSWSYEIELSYEEADGMDDSGNVQYIESTKTYTGIIRK